MNILGIDQSLSKTAIVLTNDNKIIDYLLIKTNTKDITEKRIKDIGDIILKFIIKNKVSLVNIESLPYSAQSRSVRPLAGLYYYLTIMMFDIGIKYNSIEPTKLKKFASNKGNASKEDMINSLPIEVREIFNKYLKNRMLGLDDLADAYFLSIFKD